MAIRQSLVAICYAFCPAVGAVSRFVRPLRVRCGRFVFMKELKVMTQSELNHAIAKQTGESVTKIARHGFTILAELPQDDDDEPLPVEVVARKAEE